MQVAVELFHLSSDAANLSLGGVTIICALLGVLGGGALALCSPEKSTFSLIIRSFFTALYNSAKH